MIIAYVTNREKYEKGILLGKALELPVGNETLSELKQALEFSTVDSMYLLSYLCELPFVKISKGFNLEELNDLAYFLQNVKQQGRISDLYEAISSNTDLKSAIASYQL